MKPWYTNNFSYTSYTILTPYSQCRRQGGGNRQGKFAPGPGIRGPPPQCERGFPKYRKFGGEQSYGISIFEEVEEKVCGKCRVPHTAAAVQDPTG